MRCTSVLRFLARFADAFRVAVANGDFDAAASALVELLYHASFHYEDPEEQRELSVASKPFVVRTILEHKEPVELVLQLVPHVQARARSAICRWLLAAVTLADAQVSDTQRAQAARVRESLAEGTTLACFNAVFGLEPAPSGAGASTAAATDPDLMSVDTMTTVTSAGAVSSAAAGSAYKLVRALTGCAPLRAVRAALEKTDMPPAQAAVVLQEYAESMSRLIATGDAVWRQVYTSVLPSAAGTSLASSLAAVPRKEVFLGGRVKAAALRQIEELLQQHGQVQVIHSHPGQELIYTGTPLNWERLAFLSCATITERDEDHVVLVKMHDTDRDFALDLCDRVLRSMRPHEPVTEDTFEAALKKLLGCSPWKRLKTLLGLPQSITFDLLLADVLQHIDSDQAASDADTDQVLAECGVDTDTTAFLDTGAALQPSYAIVREAWRGLLAAEGGVGGAEALHQLAAAVSSVAIADGLPYGVVGVNSSEPGWRHPPSVVQAIALYLLCRKADPVTFMLDTIMHLSVESRPLFLSCMLTSIWISGCPVTDANQLAAQSIMGGTQLNSLERIGIADVLHMEQTALLDQALHLVSRSSATHNGGSGINSSGQPARASLDTPGPDQQSMLEDVKNFASLNTLRKVLAAFNLSPASRNEILRNHCRCLEEHLVLGAVIGDAIGVSAAISLPEAEPQLPPSCDPVPQPCRHSVGMVRSCVQCLLADALDSQVEPVLLVRVCNQALTQVGATVFLTASTCAVPFAEPGSTDSRTGALRHVCNDIFETNGVFVWQPGSPPPAMFVNEARDSVTTPSSPVVTPAKKRAPVSAASQVSVHHKTVLCKHFMQGRCKLGDHCKFAHGEADLRGAPVASPATPATPAAWDADVVESKDASVGVSPSPVQPATDELATGAGAGAGGPTAVAVATAAAGAALDDSQLETAYSFVLDEEVAFEEDVTHEFKRSLSTADIIKNVAAFLNSSGGTLYCGIADDGRVCGVSLNRGQRDVLRKQLDQILRHELVPAVLSEYVQLKFIPVNGAGGKDLYVVELTVLCKHPEERLDRPYVTRQDNVLYTRRQGSVDTIRSFKGLLEWHDQRCALYAQRQKSLEQQMKELADVVAKLGQEPRAPLTEETSKVEEPAHVPAYAGKLEKVKVNFTGSVRVGMRGQEEVSDFTVAWQQVYDEGGCHVMLVVQSVALGGQLHQDGRVGVGARLVRINNKKSAGLHGEAMTTLLRRVTECEFMAPPVLRRAPPPTINGQPVSTMGGDVNVLPRAPPPTINGQPVSILAQYNSGPTAARVVPMSFLIGGNSSSTVSMPARPPSPPTASATPSTGAAAYGGTSGNVTPSVSMSPPMSDTSLKSKLERLFRKA